MVLAGAEVVEVEAVARSVPLPWLKNYGRGWRVYPLSMQAEDLSRVLVAAGEGS